MSQKHLIVISGAGLSAASGIPTFRTDNGTWSKFDPDKYANIETLEEHREEVFEFYNTRRTELQNYQPNRAHHALASFQNKYGNDKITIFTQNGDDLLDRAGAKDVHYLHGKLTTMNCITCSHIWEIGYTRVSSNVTCPCCNSTKTKPGVTFFGEIAPLYEKMDQLIKKSRSETTILVVGTMGHVLDYKRLVGNRHHPRRPKTILNTLHRECNIQYSKLFDITSFTKAEDSLLSILENIKL